MYAAAAKKGGAGGVSQDVAKEFTASDEPGKLPERKKPDQKRLYKKRD
jgi:hypothetical protein